MLDNILDYQSLQTDITLYTSLRFLSHESFFVYLSNNLTTDGYFLSLQFLLLVFMKNH